MILVIIVSEQVLHILLLCPNHAHLLPWLAVQHLNAGAQRGGDDHIYDASNEDWLAASRHLYCCAQAGSMLIIILAIYTINIGFKTQIPKVITQLCKRLHVKDECVFSIVIFRMYIYDIIISVIVKVSYITYFDVWAFFCVLPIFFVIWEWTVSNSKGPFKQLNMYCFR